MYRPVYGLPGRTFIQRLLSKRARRAANRDFMFNILPKGGMVIEVGVFDGDFSERILAFNEPRHLHLVDPWSTKENGGLYDGPTQDFGSKDAANSALESQFQQVSRRFSGELAQGRLTMHRTLSYEAATLFPKSYFDWIYIDASHFYADVKRDLASFIPKLKPGGYITGDDYGRRGIWDHGVTRAVDEFVAAGQADTIRLHNHQFILRKPGF
ncbi:MAG: class I SAM-dependent methyltransferase [Gammaproteobacteria bacterium]|nr:class I SAM-dependent methyltransferase [Gammaproteobacteria bacterium]